MQTLPYNEIENADQADIGKVALMHLCGPTLAIDGTLAECLKKSNNCGMAVEDADVDDHTDHRYLCAGDLVAVIVGDISAS